MPLTSKQKQALKAEGHHLVPVVRIGQAGVTQPVVKKTFKELAAHPLIKVKVGQNSLDDVGDVAPQLADAVKAEIVQIIGRTFLLFKERKNRKHDIQEEE